MKKYGMVALVVILGFGGTACNKQSQTPASVTGETAISGAEGEQKVPLKINTNQRYTKHREVNRRIIHRMHRLHKVT